MWGWRTALSVASSTSANHHLLTTSLHRTRVLHSIRKWEDPSGQITYDSLCRLLDECRCPKSVAALGKLHSQLITRRLHADPSICIKLMRAYSACGDPSAACQVFDRSPERNIVFFNVMIRSYANNHMYKDAVLVYSHMGLEGVEPDNYTFPCVLKACSGSKDLMVGMQIHGATTKHGLDNNLFVGNALITMYARCGCSSEAVRVFEGMGHRDVVSWNALLAGYAQDGQFNQALKVCREMVELRKMKADAGTMASILPAVINTESGNVMFVRRMFNEMAHKGLVSWNAMIAVYVGNGMAAEAVELFLQMELEGIEPDAVTLASVLPACGDLSTLEVGKRIHDYVKRKRMDGNLVLDNALVDMYAKCGCLQAAREVFDTMQERDIVSWTSLISAYGMSGHGQDAMGLFEQMIESGLKPDHIAFVSVLSACSHSGLLEEGQHYFRCMTDQYQIVPTIEHFACMVDLLGRSGNVEEAFAFINHMPVKPNERVWGALLGACRVYSNMTIGLIAADELFKLVAKQPGYYVLLSNIYARAGRWEEVTSVRSIMKSRGLKKIPGCSNVEFGNRVHTFLVGERSHPQSKEIYAELDVLIGRMKEAGYVAEVDSALHDVEEEEKEGHLAVHSEKLAIVFVLINTSPGTPIRITKNLRVCGDCHTAAKLISKITEREIILRDLNRFHHFANGLCSCGDYW